MAGKRKQVDWEKIEAEYRANQLSISEIARQHDVSRAAIAKKAKAKGWTRDLSDRVRSGIKAKLVADEVAGCDAKEATDAAVERGVSIVKMQRRDIANLQSLEQQLLAELGSVEEPPTRVHVSAFQGEVTLTPLRLTVAERASSLQALANVQHKRIALQRQAFNLDEQAAPATALDDFFNAVSQRNKSMVDE